MDLSIGQMARINHISIQTLRLYDKMGLLKPVAVDAGSGYRYYSILQCAKLDLIGSLKQCGLSLKEIGSYFENGNIESLEGELRNTLDQIGTEMRRLSEQKEAVKRTLESFEQYRVAPPAGTITLEYIPRRSIIVLDSGNNYFEEGLEFYEHSLLQLKHALADRNVEHIYYRNPGTIWRKDKVMKREFVSTEVYVRQMRRGSVLMRSQRSRRECINAFTAAVLIQKRSWHVSFLIRWKRTDIPLQGIISVRLLWKHLFLRRMKEECFCGFRCL